MKKQVKKVVLAYSGGLDTSVIIPWLKENYDNCEVIAMSGDVGQGDELDGLEAKALKTGASKLYVEDLKETFVTDYIYPAVKAGAVYEKEYLLGNVFDMNLDESKRKIFASSNLFSKEDCKDCWAKYLCSGGCSANAVHFNGDINKPFSQACALMKKRTECALYVYAKERLI